ncbi:MAG: hypothetical protein V4735_09575 [Pseudomonadota bacterium]
MGNFAESVGKLTESMNALSGLGASTRDATIQLGGAVGTVREVTTIIDTTRAEHIGINRRANGDASRDGAYQAGADRHFINAVQANGVPMSAVESRAQIEALKDAQARGVSPQQFVQAGGQPVQQFQPLGQQQAIAPQENQQAGAAFAIAVRDANIATERGQAAEAQAATQRALTIAQQFTTSDGKVNLPDGKYLLGVGAKTMSFDQTDVYPKPNLPANLSAAQQAVFEISTIMQNESRLGRAVDPSTVFQPAAPAVAPAVRGNSSDAGTGAAVAAAPAAKPDAPAAGAASAATAAAAPDQKTLNQQAQAIMEHKLGMDTGQPGGHAAVVAKGTGVSEMDGDIGTKSRPGVKKLQAALGMDPTGQVTAELVAALNNPEKLAAITTTLQAANKRADTHVADAAPAAAESLGGKSFKDASAVANAAAAAAANTTLVAGNGAGESSQAGDMRAGARAAALAGVDALAREHGGVHPNAVAHLKGKINATFNRLDAADAAPTVATEQQVKQASPLFATLGNSFGGASASVAQAPEAKTTDLQRAALAATASLTNIKGGQDAVVVESALGGKYRPAEATISV